jgi:hypothetical protein
MAQAVQMRYQDKMIFFYFRLKAIAPASVCSQPLTTNEFMNDAMLGVECDSLKLLMRVTPIICL